MAIEFNRYKPLVPIETVIFLGQEVRTWKWYPYPSRNFWGKPRLEQTKLVDESDTLVSLAEVGGLREHLEAIDLTVGCRFPCQTCIRDSQNLSSIMSFEAASKIIRGKNFSQLLPEWSVCVGYTSEPADNPNVLEIMKLILDATADKQNGFRVTLKTNYPKQKEDTLRQLLILAGNNKRMVLTVSLPLNEDNKIQDDFDKFKKSNEELLSKARAMIFDLKNPEWQEIENLGRILPGAKDTVLTGVEMFQTRGKGGLLLNPEGLWLMVNATKFEAHTPEIFTLITPENVGLIGSRIGSLNQTDNMDFVQARGYKQIAERTQTKFSPRIS